MFLKRVAKAVGLVAALCSGAMGQFNQYCTVSVLNRNVQVNPDGTWVLPNVPANFGQVKAHATCVRNGVTTSGESAFFTITPNTAVNLPDIVLGVSSQIPTSLSIVPSPVSFTSVGQTTQLTVTAAYPDNSTKNVTAASTGTNYTASNPAIATISADGMVTAVASGTVVIQATNDGASGILTAKVTLPSADTDGDGIPDGVEIQLGMNPNDPTDAQQDFDRDGLTNLQEYWLGTDIRNLDTDGDGLSDGDEVNKYHMSPLIADTDSDGIPDGIIVGSEAILRNDVSITPLLAYMTQVRQAIPSNISVITADAYGTFLANPSLIAASEIVFANFYPYWEGTSINNALCSLEQEYQQRVSALRSKQVLISETGWPTGGATVGAAVPSAANGALYALQFLSWANSNNIPAFYFEAFDEPWKAAYEGLQDAYWGIFDANGVIKPGMGSFFNGQTVVVNCNGLIPGPLAISFSYVPPYGSLNNLGVQVTGVQPPGFKIATYILVNGGWWSKPTFAQPTMPVSPDGSALVTFGTSHVWTRPDLLVGDSAAPPLPEHPYGRRTRGLPIPGCPDVNREET